MILTTIFKAAVFFNMSLSFSKVFKSVFLNFRVKFYNVEILINLS
jgi:hypothetical protein